MMTAQSTTTADPTLHNVSLGRIRSLQRLHDGRSGSTAIYIPEGSDKAPRTFDAPNGAATITNSHWLLIRTPATAKLFDRLLAKMLKSQRPIVNRTSIRQIHVERDDDGSWAVGQSIPDARRLVEDFDFAGYAPMQTVSAFDRGPAAYTDIRAMRLDDRSADGKTYVGFQSRYLLPLLACGYRVDLNDPYSAARLVDANGDFAGLLMPSRL